MDAARRGGHRCARASRESVIARTPDAIASRATAIIMVTCFMVFLVGSRAVRKLLAKPGGQLAFQRW